MEFIYQKIGITVISFIVSFLFGLIPIYLAWKVSKVSSFADYTRLRTALSLLSCLSAGVFLGTCLLELFPEVQISLMEAFERYGISSSFPFAQFVTAVGFFIVITIETLFFSFHKVFIPENDHAPVQSTSDLLYGSFSDNQTTLRENINNNVISNDVFPTIADSSAFRTSRLSFSLSTTTGEKPFRAFILFAALSMHTFFEGLDCGLEPQDGSLWQFAVALCVHKPLITIGINMSFLRTSWGQVRFTLLMNLLFSLMSPIGIAIGIVGSVTQTFDLSAVLTVTGIFQGLASGAFLYVVFLEVLPYEMAAHAEGCKRIANLLALVLGFGISVAMETAHVSRVPLCSETDD